MPQISKLIPSRNKWKGKAGRRANEIREYRKSQKRHQEKIAELKAQIATMKTLIEKKKSQNLPAPTYNIDRNEAQQTRILCVLLVLQAVVSYRSVPRILNLFNTKT
jgi:hypothetical protein